MVYGDDTTTFPNPDNDEDKMMFLTGRDVQKYFEGDEKPLRKPLSRKKIKPKDVIFGSFRSLFKRR